MAKQNISEHCDNGCYGLRHLKSETRPQVFCISRPQDIMYFSTPVLVAALASIAHAQTPPSFTPQVNTKLEVIFNSTMVNTGGEQLAKAGE
jgi:hypothetical protein